MSAASTSPNGAPAAPAAPKQDGATPTVSELRATAQERAGRRLSPLPTDPPSQLDAAAASFWSDVNAGRIRLTAIEDQMVWDLRAAHWRWDYIARHILRRRSVALMRIAKAHAALERNRAIRWRAEYRRNKEGSDGR